MLTIFQLFCSKFPVSGPWPPRGWFQNGKKRVNFPLKSNTPLQKKLKSVTNLFPRLLFKFTSKRIRKENRDAAHEDSNKLPVKAESERKFIKASPENSTNTISFFTSNSYNYYSRFFYHTMLRKIF